MYIIWHVIIYNWYQPVCAQYDQCLKQCLMKCFYFILLFCLFGEVGSEEGVQSVLSCHADISDLT